MFDRASSVFFRACLFSALLLPPLAAGAASAHAAGPRLVLADYLPWYDNWDDCRIVKDDKPRERYHSDDGGAIGRHVEQAVGAGIDAFVVHWVSPGGRAALLRHGVLRVSLLHGSALGAGGGGCSAAADRPPYGAP